MVFILSSFVLLIFNGSTLYDKKNLILMLVFLLIPIIGFGVQSLFLTSPLILLVTSIISDIGILIVYTIKYSNKSRKILLDIFKLLWVYLLCITHLTSFIFKLQHWPYQNEISNLAGIGYIPLIIVFYVDGFKNKYLLSKTSNNTN